MKLNCFSPEQQNRHSALTEKVEGRLHNLDGRAKDVAQQQLRAPLLTGMLRGGFALLCF